MSKMVNLIGERVGQLTVIKRDYDTAENFYKKYNRKLRFWICKCDCGNYTILDSNRLLHKKTLSCGCLNRGSKTHLKNKNNIYKLYKNYGVCTIIPKNIDFIFDLEDYDKIKKHTWNILDGYIFSHVNKEQILLGNFILDTNNINYKNNNKLDNRKNNLRIATKAEITIATQNIRDNNTSGFIGVSWKKDKNKWKSYISVNGRQIHLGYFGKKEDAIQARKDGENKYYNEFSKYYSA